MNIPTNDNRTARHYVVVDVEVLNATAEYEAYKAMDPRAADLRWPFRRVCAASLLSFSVTDEGLFEFGQLKSYSGNDEARLLKQLFNSLRELPSHVLVSWGGNAFDLPVLRMGAAEHELTLPRQLVHSARDRYGWCHRDLALEVKAGAGSYIHMSEMAVRLHLPVKFGGSAAEVPMLVADEKWERLQGIPSADVITTTMLMASHLFIHGAMKSASAAHIVILDQVRRREPYARYCDYLGRVQARIERQAMTKAEAFVRLAV